MQRHIQRSHSRRAGNGEQQGQTEARNGRFHIKSLLREQQGRPPASLMPEMVVFVLKAYYGEQQGRASRQTEARSGRFHMARAIGIWANVVLAHLMAYYRLIMGSSSARLRPEMVVFILKAYYGEQQCQTEAGNGRFHIQNLLWGAAGPAPARLRPEMVVFILKAYYGEQQGRPPARLRPEMVVFILKAYYKEQQGRPAASLRPEMLEFI